MRRRFRRESLFAGQCFVALFSGRETEEAEIAGEELHIALHYVRLYVEATDRAAKKRRR